MKHLFANHDLATSAALMLGAWQRVFLCELDRARPRKIFMQVMGM
jgi:thiamine phosphate synthase YjbQ (UPF0047 family)